MAIADDADSYADLAQEITPSLARISNGAIVYSIVLPSLFQITISFTLPSFPMPEILREVGMWLAFMISFDFGSVGASECSLNGSIDANQGNIVWLKFFGTNLAFIVLCILLTIPERVARLCRQDSKRQALQRVNARVAAYTLALPALTRAWADKLQCTQLPDGTFGYYGNPNIRCNLFVPLLFAFLWAVLVPGKLFWNLRNSAKDGNWSPDEIRRYAWLLLKYKPDSWYFVSSAALHLQNLASFFLAFYCPWSG